MLEKALKHYIRTILIILTAETAVYPADTLYIWPKIPEQFFWEPEPRDKLPINEPFYIEVFWNYVSPTNELFDVKFNLKFYSPDNIDSVIKVPGVGGEGRAVLPAPYENVVLKNGFHDYTYWNLLGSPTGFPSGFYVFDFDGDLPDHFGHHLTSDIGFPGNFGPAAHYELHYRIDQIGTFCIDSVSLISFEFDWAFYNNNLEIVNGMASSRPWCWETSDCLGTDTDKDRVADICDNCPNTYNSDQFDFDNDGVGDACDTCIDTDLDGFGNPGHSGNTCAEDNCPSQFNPFQEDSDNDGIGDWCDPVGDTLINYACGIAYGLQLPDRWYDRQSAMRFTAPFPCRLVRATVLICNHSRPETDTTGDLLFRVYNSYIREYDSLSVPEGSSIAEKIVGNAEINALWHAEHLTDSLPITIVPLEDFTEGKVLDLIAVSADLSSEDLLFKTGDEWFISVSAATEGDSFIFVGDNGICDFSRSVQSFEYGGEVYWLPCSYGYDRGINLLLFADLAIELDSDNDGIPDQIDNCPFVINLEQPDFDQDGVGNECENCLYFSNSDQADDNLDGIGNACTFSAVTAAGENVSVDLGSIANLTFQNVIQSGISEMTVSPVWPITDSFAVVPQEVPAVYNFATTALFEGTATLCFSYDQSYIGDLNESLLRIQQFDGSQWQNITSALNYYSNTICGKTDSLSSCALAVWTFTCGNVNGIGLVNSLDIIYLVAYLFKNGRPPQPLEAGDVNGNRVTNILDVTYLIRYVFKRGTAPICP